MSNDDSDRIENPMTRMTDDDQRPADRGEGVAHRVLGVQALFAAGAQVLAQEVHGIVNHDAQGHGDDD